MRCLIILIQILFALSLNAQKVLIGIFYDVPLKSVVFAPAYGSYKIYCDNDLTEITDFRSAVSIHPVKDSLVITFIDGKKLRVTEIKIVSENRYAYFRLCHNLKPLYFRLYDDGLIVRNRFGNLLLVNEVDINDYLCGVLEKEAGKKKHSEYYKTQAVLCRTYWAKARPNHYAEGFELCDGTHCQAFMGKSSEVKAIVEAVTSTDDIIACDTSGLPITAVFHSNCGGQTEASENVWSNPKPYLKPVTDQYCMESSNSTWSKTISQKEWIQYLGSCGFKIDSGYDISHFGFPQENRTKYYKVGNDSVQFVRLRSELKLKSAFFSVVPGDGVVKLYGRGYGHGVGLCQEGAMNMAKKGKSFEEIIHFYFTNVELRSISEDEIFQRPKDNLQNR